MFDLKFKFQTYLVLVCSTTCSNSRFESLRMVVIKWNFVESLKYEI